MATVETKTPAIEAMQTDLDKVKALLGGTDMMRQKGERYLPRWPAEDEESYAFRKSTTTLFNAFAHTVEQLAGKPFEQPITLSEDFDSTLVVYAEDIDSEGRNLQVFAHDVFFKSVAHGLTHILVDYPEGAEAQTKAQETELGLRPYSIHIDPCQVIGFKTANSGGKTVLTQFRYMETVEEYTSEFEVKTVEQVRVLEPGKWATYRRNSKQEWALHEEGATSLSYIPLVTIYSNRTGFMQAKPPLADLIDLNIKHWQSQSDQDTILHVARVPLLAVIGLDDGKSIVVGTKAATELPTGGDMKFVEHSGAAIGAGRESLQDLEEQMRLLGAELLVKKASALSATQANIDDRNEKSALQQMAMNLEDGLNLMFAYMADWIKTQNTGTVSVFRDFSTFLGGDQTPAVLLNSATAGKISDQTYFEEMKRRGLIDDARTWEEEQERLQNQEPALGMINGPPDSSI